MSALIVISPKIPNPPKNCAMLTPSDAEILSEESVILKISAFISILNKSLIYYYLAVYDVILPDILSILFHMK